MVSQSIGSHLYETLERTSDGAGRGDEVEDYLQ